MIYRYYIIYVFQGAGLTGRRGNLIADSVQYVLNVVFTSTCAQMVQWFALLMSTSRLAVPAILYIDRWGRRPMLLFGTFFMGFWLMLVGGLQGGFGSWGTVDGSRAYSQDFLCNSLIWSVM